MKTQHLVLKSCPTFLGCKMEVNVKQFAIGEHFRALDKGTSEKLIVAKSPQDLIQVFKENCSKIPCKDFLQMAIPKEWYEAISVQEKTMLLTLFNLILLPF